MPPTGLGVLRPPMVIRSMAAFAWLGVAAVRAIFGNFSDAVTQELHK